MSEKPLNAAGAVDILEQIIQENFMADQDLTGLNRVIDFLKEQQEGKRIAFLTGVQTKAIARVMEASPVLISEDDSSAVYAVHANSYSESILAHFGRWQEQHICQTKMELTSDGATTYRLEASRVSFPEHDLCKMDALCKAWIQFRVKMEQDVKNREEAPANDDLGDLREHPF